MASHRAHTLPGTAPGQVCHGRTPVLAYGTSIC